MGLRVRRRRDDVRERQLLEVRARRSRGNLGRRLPAESERTVEVAVRRLGLHRRLTGPRGVDAALVLELVDHEADVMVLVLRHARVAVASLVRPAIHGTRVVEVREALRDVLHRRRAQVLGQWRNGRSKHAVVVEVKREINAGGSFERCLKLLNEARTVRTTRLVEPLELAREVERLLRVVLRVESGAVFAIIKLGLISIRVE